MLYFEETDRDTENETSYDIITYLRILAEDFQSIGCAKSFHIFINFDRRIYSGNKGQRNFD